MRDQTSPLHSTDRLIFAFWGFLSLVSIGLHSRLQFWWTIPAADAVAIVLVWVLARADQARSSKVLRWAHDWAAFPMVIFTYKEIYYLIRPLHHWKDYDQVLMTMDRALFRVNPTEWLASFANPCLTEVLQIAYSLFYAIFLIIGLELYRNGEGARFPYFRFTIVYGFFLSYIGYFFLPSIGPRFTLHDFSRIEAELPGLLLTPALRWFVNAFESIYPGMSNAVAAAAAQRDVFPSGHTMMTIVAIILAYRFRTRVRTWMLGLGILLVIATVYLRYHYVVDLAAGTLLAILCLMTSSRIHALFKATSPE